MVECRSSGHNAFTSFGLRRNFTRSLLFKRRELPHGPTSAHESKDDSAFKTVPSPSARAPEAAPRDTPPLRSQPQESQLPKRLMRFSAPPERLGAHPKQR